MKNRDIEMQEHLSGILNEYSLRKNIINRLYLDTDTYVFLPEISEEMKWDYYNFVCRELGIKDKVIRGHGMNSKDASNKKKIGHNFEHHFENFGYKVIKGTGKPDLIKDGIYASLKGGGKTIQWGMHVLSSISEKNKALLSQWILSYGKKNVSLDDRKELADVIISKLENKEIRRELFNNFFKMGSDLRDLIIVDHSENVFIRVNYDDFIDTLVDELVFHKTDGRVKIVGKMKLSNKMLNVIEIEPRKDKNNCPILMHGPIDKAVSVIKEHNIRIHEKFKIK